MMNLGGAIRINKCGVTILLVVAVLLLLLFYNSQKSPDIPSSAGFGGASSSKISQAFNDGRQISVQALLIAAVDVAERGGNEVREVRQSSNGNLGEQIKGKTKEGAKDRVTQGDFRSHRVMYYGLRKAFPHIKVISEEHDTDPDVRNIEPPSLVNPEISSTFIGDEKIAADDISIWIDPLDATQEYTENLLEYVTTMVCVAVKGVPIIGVIHRPFSHPVETYWAVVGYGHSKNLDIPKEPSKNSDPSRKLKFIASRSHTGPVENATAQLLGGKQSYEIIKAAGAGYKVLEIIKGNVDAYIHVTYIKKWDLCAGNAILNALEGVMVTLNGDKLDYSPDTDPVNAKGLIAYMKTNEDKFKDLTLDIDA